MRFCPLIQNSSSYFSRLKRVCCTQTLTSTEHHISSLHSHLWVQLSYGSPYLWPDKKQKFLQFFITNIIIIRECGSTLYVGLACTAPPTNPNFRLAFLLIRLQEAFYEDLPVLSIKFEVYYHFSGLNFIAEVNFWHPRKTVISCS